jgi:hypothetical protein
MKYLYIRHFLLSAALLSDIVIRSGVIDLIEVYNIVLLQIIDDVENLE